MFRLGLTCALLVLAFTTSFVAQKRATETWLRVTTGDDFVIDVDRTSLAFGDSHVIEATFRTTHTDPQPLSTQSGPYRSQLDTIAFQTNGPDYRVIKSLFLSDSGKVLLEQNPQGPQWRHKGKAAARLYGAATQLAPFGQWKVHSYKYASGEGPSKDDPEELTSLIGKDILFSPSRVAIGDTGCYESSLVFASITGEDAFKRLGIQLSDLGIEGSTMRAIRATCSNKDEGTFIFLLSPDKAKLLWNGVFFDIERPGNIFLP